MILRKKQQKEAEDAHFEEIMDSVPNRNGNEETLSKSNKNAYVVKNKFGRIGIYINGFWLGAKINDFEVDIAPFCG